MLVCTWVIGVLNSERPSRLICFHVNSFLEECSSNSRGNKPIIEAAFVSGGALIELRPNAAHLESGHSIRYIPPYNSFYNPNRRSLWRIQVHHQEMDVTMVHQTCPKESQLKAVDIDYLGLLTTLYFSSYNRHFLVFIETGLEKADL